MRRQPLRIGRIAGEPAPDLVINTAPDHLIQAQTGLYQGLLVPGEITIMEEEPDGKCLWKFGRCSETALYFIRGLQQIAGYPPQCLSGPGLRPERRPIPLASNSRIPGQ